MQVRRGKIEQVEQPESFEFTKANFKKAEQIIAKYPEGRQRSAVMPLLDIAQRQNDNWLPVAAMDYVASILSMPPMRVYEVASFYTMYNMKPVGRHFVQICTTTPCWLRGSDAVVAAAKKHLGIGLNETTEDGEFTLIEVECLGACANAPMCQIGDEYYEDLDEDSTIAVLKALAKGQKPKPGSQIGRISSEPIKEREVS